ncbi:ArgE/DapE family deacylase [Limosilactobacillus equigenerosi]|uniref:Probable succinyl-diaminopimelate desuccinylase n=1 Tax=Limosilactobacillus equigenerosi DSM 18793 = JCM 14505 TaxID=1423742 RepID=A0A0R1V0B4_9LACO|nr:ArgE/DapE family deacylase [Limosilactobacillus equigenerosi]KRL96466.1 Peptidase [Limosilactobacillus equigenerosi DSM 18793 = JCM 14505]MCQ2569594.1 ArgE/DapE family deacylase [Limosilactobacillus sp.]
METAQRIKILQDLVRINSVNGNELAVAEYLQKLLAQYGLKATVDRFDETRANLILELGEGKADQILGLTGHLDTVAVEDETTWTYPPFAATIVGDRLYGRGAADMKSGVAAQAIAIIELVTAGVRLPGKLRWMLTAGEEYGTPGANRLLAAGYADDLAALYVGEPTSGNVVYAHSGSLNYRIISHGKAVHSSRPADGINAVDGLIDFAVAERTLFDNAPVHPALGTVKHSVTILKAGEQINTLPDVAELRGNIRPTPSFDNEQVIASLQRVIERLNQQPGTNLKLEVIHSFYPVASDPASGFVQKTLTAFQTAYQAYPMHTQPHLAVINGATDASVFVKANRQLPVIVVGADNWEISHMVDEYTTLSSFTATINGYKTAIQSFFA